MPMLEGAELQALVDALTDAYDPNGLAMMLRFRLNRKLHNLAAPGAFPFMVFQVVEASERQGWTGELIAGARESNPGNPKLAELAIDLGEAGLSSAAAPTRSEATAKKSALQRLVRDDTPFNNIAEWLARWGQLEVRVCRVEVYKPGAVGPGTGTGFLVGPDLLLTNHHVLADVIAGDVEPKRVLCRFDYKRLQDGMSLSAGVEYGLDHGGEWLLDHSPPSPEDEKTDGAVPTLEHLDFALVRLEKKAGALPIGKSPEPGAPKRGWIEVADAPAELAHNAIVFLLQHPKGDPMVQSSGKVLEVLKTGDKQIRVRHDANTLEGSSGSPVFAADLSLAALHHSGDPDYGELHHPEYNQAIPLGRIVERLTAKGIDLD